mgnify:CR=1 FL=1
MNKFFLLALAITAVTAEKYNWAVLVAGSNGYSNYRHQSDVCHAYQILIKHGMDPTHIIVMAYDDIATNSRNPIQGKIFNRPDGDDVYGGCVLDYTGKDVTPSNWMKIVTGDEEGMKGIGSGKVLKSTENSNVFMFYSDHGSSGLIAFPSGYLYADDLQKTLDTMHEKKMYKKLVFYMEACYAGSMFENYADMEAKGIFGVTAANAHQSSYACYCGSEAKVGGISIGSCLGDEFSCNWMENSDAVDFSTYKIGEQVDHVTEVTKGSNVMQYGDRAPRDQVLAEYQGDADHFVAQLAGFLKAMFADYHHIQKQNVVMNENMLLAYLRGVAESSKKMRDWEAYQDELIMAERSKNIFNEFVERLHVEKQGEVDFDCYRNVMKIYERECGVNVDRDHGYFKHFYNYCSMRKGFWPAYHALHDICQN